jgi:hypothetical protein
LSKIVVDVDGLIELVTELGRSKHQRMLRMGPQNCFSYMGDTPARSPTSHGINRKTF